MPRFFSRLLPLPFLAALSLFSIVAVYAQVPTNDAQARLKPRSNQKLIREGMRVELKGHFHGGGVERYVFQPTESANSFQVLENLALERIDTTVNGKTREWSIIAEVTEFNGANYLIIKRATVRSGSRKSGSR